MPSTTFEILNNQRDPKTVLEAIVEAIRQAEREAPLPEALRAWYDKQGGVQRSWGSIRGELGEFTAIDAADERKFKLTMVYEDYCRGCWMGTETLDLFIPDELVEAYEIRERGWESDDWAKDGVPDDALDRFNVLLIKYIAERVVGIQDDYEKAEGAAIRAKEAEARRVEAAERNQLAELQAKYGTNQGEEA